MGTDSGSALLERMEGIRFAVCMLRKPDFLRFAVLEANHDVFPIADVITCAVSACTRAGQELALFVVADALTVEIVRREDFCRRDGARGLGWVERGGSQRT